MKIALSLLEKYIKIDNEYSLSDDLTMIGHEVEFIKEHKFKKIVIGRIESIEKHPNADKLTLCKVNVGKVLNIVCGAKNHKVNDLVVVALPGSYINGEEIKNSDVRGVTSEGMLCSASELGLSQDHEGILILDEGNVGEDLNNIFNDTIFNLSITPNRPDILSHLGVARELSAKYGVELPKMEELEIDFQNNEMRCDLYVAIYLENVKVKASPQWLKKYLMFFDNKIINNFVDVSNFVMYELGQPTHMFDADKIKGKLRVEKAPFCKVLALDNKEYALDSNDLVIVDDEKIVAIAGLIGCANSSVDSNTKNIIVEIGNFDSSGIRRTSKKLNLSTESSYRFERGLYENPKVVAKRVLTLLKDNFTEHKILISHRLPLRSREIKFSTAEMNQILGINISSVETKQILNSLNIEVDKNIAYIPEYRSDLKREVDIYEEVARIYGYENIPIVMPKVQVNPSLEKKDKKILLSLLGLNEVINYSFVPEGYGKRAIVNPITEDFKVMRDSLLYSIIKNIAYNLNNGVKLVEIFEIGRVYKKEEEERVAIAISGFKEKTIYEDKREVDFFDLKGLLISFANELNWDLEFIPSEIDNMHPFRTAKIFKDSLEIGYIAEVEQSYLNKFGIKRKVYFAEFASLNENPLELKEISKYPYVERELSMLFDKDVAAGVVVKELCTHSLIKSYSILDIYEGSFANRKSISFKFKIQSNFKTLTEEEINEVVTNVIKKSEKYNAEVRLS